MFITWKNCKPTLEHINNDAINASYRWVRGVSRRIWLFLKWQKVIMEAGWLSMQSKLEYLQVNSNRAVKKCAHHNVDAKTVYKRLSFFHRHFKTAK